MWLQRGNQIINPVQRFIVTAKCVFQLHRNKAIQTETRFPDFDFHFEEVGLQMAMANLSTAPPPTSAVECGEERRNAKNGSNFCFSNVLVTLVITLIILLKRNKRSPTLVTQCLNRTTSLGEVWHVEHYDYLQNNTELFIIYLICWTGRILPSFAPTLLTKRPSFAHTMLSKRRCIAPTLYGQTTVVYSTSKRPSFTHTMLTKRR